MPNDSKKIQRLAIFASTGLATAEQLNELFRLSYPSILASISKARREGLIMGADCDDIAQDAIIRAYVYGLKNWDSTRGSWLTFLEQITQSAIGDRRRQYAKAAKLMQELADDRHPTPPPL